MAISNRELLSEIHKSKLTYCSVPVEERHCSYARIVERPEDLTGAEGEIIRFMRRAEKWPFPAFAHYEIVAGRPVEVLRSHWRGDLATGCSDDQHGRLTNRLGEMIVHMVERYSTRGNWRGYSYVDEMRANAMLALVQAALKFDESKSSNPFAYYTASMSNAFVRVLNLEKRQHLIRDDLLIDAGQLPSFARQVADSQLQRDAALKANVSVEPADG